MVSHVSKGQTFEFGERDLVVIEEVSEPGGEWEAPLHRHFHCDEAWYILKGSFGFLVDGKTLQAKVGDMVYVKPGQAHTYWNSSKGEGRYLLFMTHNIQKLIEALEEVDQDDEQAMAEVYRRFDGQLIR